MKKIINNKKYDTETATSICSRTYYNNGLPCSWDTIYRKKTGEFFLYHEINGQDCYDLKEYIQPLDESDAKEKCQEWMDGDDYEEVFGEVEE